MVVWCDVVGRTKHKSARAVGSDRVAGCRWDARECFRPDTRARGRQLAWIPLPSVSKKNGSVRGRSPSLERRCWSTRDAMSRKRGGEECGYAIVGPAVVSVGVGVINGVGVDVED